jgi:inositol hexakisphosphate/diphosphoinositol-pentakisphosphate kinase
MRVFEDSRWAMDDPRRFRVEILFSPGATATPMHMKELDREQDQSRFDTAPLQLISREGLTCREVEDFFEQAIVAGRSDEDSVGHASTSAEGGKQAKVKKDKKKDKKVSLPTASLVPEPEMAVPCPVPTPISLVEKVASEELVTTFPAVIETVNPPDVLPPHLDELSVKTDPLSPDDTYPLEVAVTGRSLGLEVDDDNHGDRQVSDTADGDMDENAKGDMDTQESIEIVGGGGGGDDDKDPTGTDNDKAARKLISRKYFWGTIAVASFAVGLTCIVVALTLSQDARRTRRWSTRRY